jgi:hypothetical protein
MAITPSHDAVWCSEPDTCVALLVNAAADEVAVVLVLAAFLLPDQQGQRRAARGLDADSVSSPGFARSALATGGGLEGDPERGRDPPRLDAKRGRATDHRRQLLLAEGDRGTARGRRDAGLRPWLNISRRHV